MCVCVCEYRRNELSQISTISIHSRLLSCHSKPVTGFKSRVRRKERKYAGKLSKLARLWTMKQTDEHSVTSSDFVFVLTGRGRVGRGVFHGVSCFSRN